MLTLINKNYRSTPCSQNIVQIVKLLALALTNLVLSLVNLVTNLAKPSLGQPSHKPDQT